MELKKADETRRQIIEVAFGLFLRKGYHGTAMSELVTETGVSKGSFYYHFKSKEGLYGAVIDSYLAPLFTTAPLDELRDKSLHQSLQFLLLSYRKSIRLLKSLVQGNNANYYSLFFEALQELPAFRQTVQNYYTTLKGIMAKKMSAENNTSKAKAEKMAINQIARFEGLIFWSAIFPDANSSSLLMGPG